MKLFITRPLPEIVVDAAREDFDVTVAEDNTPLTEIGAKAALHIYDAILPTIGDAFRGRAFEEGTRAGILANFGVGYNHIDVDAAKALDIVVTNTPGAVTEATADIALMLMLMSCRRASEGERLVRAGKWTGWHPTQLLGLHMSGKTLGIVGMGRIGQAIAKRAHHGFGMNVVFHNRSQKDAGDHATQLGSLREVMETADVIVVAVPATPETHHLINGEMLSLMRSGAHLVNIARGDIVDQEALISALDGGRIAGAGLDVYENEPEVPEALRVLENATLLPHLGTAALEVREAMGLMAVENLRAFKRGETPPNSV